MTDLPAERQLHALARRFDDAERRVRALLRQAPAGNRRELLRQALEILLDLRREAQGAGAGVEEAYAVTTRALERLTGFPGPDRTRVRDLGDSLAVQLDRLVRRAEEGSRIAFAQARTDHVDDLEHEAVTGRVDQLGNRRPIGAEAGMLTSTVGRHAVTRAVRDTVGPGGATVHLEPAADTPCHARAGAGRWPPYHPNCRCTASPSGYSLGQFVGAMTSP